jgi:hypothetical protein
MAAVTVPRVPAKKNQIISLAICPTGGREVGGVLHRKEAQHCKRNVIYQERILKCLSNMELLFAVLTGQ